MVMHEIKKVISSQMSQHLIPMRCVEMIHSTTLGIYQESLLVVDDYLEEISYVLDKLFSSRTENILH